MTRLVDDLQASLSSARENAADADARLETLESRVSELTKATAAFETELQGQARELQSLRLSTQRIDALAAAARALLS